MATPIAISEAEALVMDVLWRADDALSSEKVSAALAKQQKWQETTVKTLLGRLLRKGAIRAEREQRRYLYTPVLTREQWLSIESKRLLNRLFGGKLAPLVAHFGEHHRLSRQDIADLKRLVAEMDDDG